MNFFAFHIGDYAKHTKHLTLMEDLAYRRMIEYYYITERPLPHDPERVARVIGMREHTQEVEAVLADFFLHTDAGWENKRCEQEIMAYRKKVNSAKSALKARWNMKSDMKSDMDHIPTNPNPNPNKEKEYKEKESPPVPPGGGNGVCLLSDNSFGVPELQVLVDAIPGIKPSKILSGPVLATIKARLAEHPAREFWETFAESVAQSDFLCGRTNDFQASLAWLCGPKNFSKVRAGVYDNHKYPRAIPKLVL